MSRLPSSRVSSPPALHSAPNNVAHQSPQTPLRPQTRKITIKNLKSTPDSVPAAYFQQTSAKLSRAVDTILSEGTLTDSLEELYRGVENLVRENKGNELYDMLQTKCREFVAGRLEHNVEIGIAVSSVVGIDGGIGGVEAVERAWGKWTSQLVRRLLFLWLTALGPYQEHLLLPRPSAYSHQPQVVVHNVLIPP
jgi:Cullin family